MRVKKLKNKMILIQKSENLYKCIALFKLANDFGIEPDIWFSSICNLSKLRRLPISSGKEPVSLFPLRSLKPEKENRNAEYSALLSNFTSQPYLNKFLHLCIKIYFSCK